MLSSLSDGPLRVSLCDCIVLLDFLGKAWLYPNIFRESNIRRQGWEGQGTSATACRGRRSCSQRRERAAFHREQFALIICFYENLGDCALSETTTGESPGETARNVLRDGVTSDRRSPTAAGLDLPVLILQSPIEPESSAPPPSSMPFW